MILHAVSTPLIEVAEDLKTAKGMFYSPGYVTTIEANRNALRQVGDAALCRGFYL